MYAGETGLQRKQRGRQITAGGNAALLEEIADTDFEIPVEQIFRVGLAP